MKISYYTDSDGAHLVKEFENGIKGDYLISPTQKYLDETLKPMQPESDARKKEMDTQAKRAAKLAKFADSLPD